MKGFLSLTYSDQRWPAMKSVVIVETASGSAATVALEGFVPLFGFVEAFFLGGMVDVPTARRSLPWCSCAAPSLYLNVKITKS